VNLMIRAYNVLFGDCILVSWDEDDRRHHAWVDFGNFHNDRNDVFDVVYRDVLARTGGRLDLLVITHRHLDHLEGFHSLRRRFRDDFRVERVWHAHVSRDADDLFKLADRTLAGVIPAELRAGPGSGDVGRIYRNNLYLSTKERMDDIEETFGDARIFAIHRGRTVVADGALPPGMQRMKVEVLAPEEDSRRYLVPVAEHLAARRALDGYFRSWAPAAPRDVPPGPVGAATLAADVADDSPPEFLRLADFARLRRLLRGGGMDLLAAVDRTRNNTSIVSRWTYEGVTLLLTGDAEIGSWDIIRGSGASLRSTLLKVGHHGSINASPGWSFSQVFPSRQSSNAVLLSTEPTRFTGENEVPKLEVVDGWTARVRFPSRFRRTDSVPPGEAVEVVFVR
jgi:hypothetical protein